LSELLEQLSKKINDIFISNPLIWGMEYYQEHFRKPSPQFHTILLKESLSNDYLAVQAPRGSAKSTILNFLKCSHSISFKKKRFIVILQNTYAKSCGSLEAIATEFRNNDMLKSTYKVEITRDREGDMVFTHPDGFSTRVLCKGADQIGTIRGERFGAYRPDLFLGDDIEDDELVRNPARRQELKRQFNDVLKFAGDDGTQFVIVGTILHDDSLMRDLVSKDKYLMYRKLFFKSRFEDKEGKLHSIWKDKWTLKDLAQMEKEDHISFAKEMQGDPSSGMAGNFNQEDFRYYRAVNDEFHLLDEEGRITKKWKKSMCRAAIGCDLAWEEKRTSDESVFMPAYITPDSEIIVGDYINKKGMRPNEIEEILFSMESRIRTETGSSVHIGFEKAKLEKIMKFLLKEAMKRRNKYLIFKDLLWDRDKITRIVTRLEPRYSQHTIYHKRNMGDLEYQIIKIPHGTHDDLPDALQGAVQLLKFPKRIKKSEQEDSNFTKLLNWSKDYNKPKKHVFGKKNKFEIKTNIHPFEKS